MFKSHIVLFVLGSISPQTLEDMVTPCASDTCAGQNPGTPHKDTEHPAWLTEDFSIPEITFCGQDKNQSPQSLNVVTNHNGWETGKWERQCGVVTLVKIQGRI